MNDERYIIDFGHGIKPISLSTEEILNLVEEYEIDQFSIANPNGGKIKFIYNGDNWTTALMESHFKSRKTSNKYQKDKPLDKSRHYMKATRGINRKNQSYVPEYKKKEHADSLQAAKRILGIAKTASSGTWKISQKQAIELADKYNFKMPNKKKHMKHLGSTGIMLVWKNGKYYLYKRNKHIRG